MGARLRHAALLLCALRSLHLGYADNITHFSVNAFLCAFTSGDALVAALPAEGVVIEGIIAGASPYARVALQDVDATADNTRATLLIGGPGNASQIPFLGRAGGNFRGSLVSFQLLPGQQLNWSNAAVFFTVVPDSGHLVPLSASQFSCSCEDTRCAAPSASANASGVRCMQVRDFERVEVSDTDDAGTPSEQRQLRHVSRVCVQSSACGEERGPCPASDDQGDHRRPPSPERPPAPSRPPRPPPPLPRPPRSPAARTPPPSAPPTSMPPAPEQPPGGTQPQGQPAFPALSQQRPPPLPAAAVPAPAPPSPSSSHDARSNRAPVIGIVVACCCAVLGSALCVAVTLRTLRSRYSRMSAAAPLLDAPATVEPQRNPPAVAKPAVVAGAAAEDEVSTPSVTRGVELTRLWTASCSTAAVEHAGDADV